MPDIVNGLLLCEQEVLMAHRSPQRASYPDSWSFPGGHVEGTETLEQALLRELSEEIGITATSWRFLRLFEAAGLAGASPVVFHFFTIDTWNGVPTNLGHEHTEIRWVPLQDAPQMPNLTFPIYADLCKDLIAR